jgi:SAM-dependent methyltransferase
MATPSAPTIWAYEGIVAAAYDRFFGDEPFWDQPFYAQRLRANGGRALELACGTGRLLLPLLRDGLAVDGLDTSADMLAILHAKAARLGLALTTWQLPMQAFALPRCYRSVFVPAGSFGILTGDDEIDATLACCHAALEPGGELLLPLSTESPRFTAGDHWQLRRDVAVPDHALRLRVFEQWHPTAEAMVARWQLRYELTRADGTIEHFERSHLLRQHAADAFAQRLVAAGFTSVTARRGYAEMPSDDPTDDLVFSARRDTSQPR